MKNKESFLTNIDKIGLNMFKTQNEIYIKGKGVFLDKNISVSKYILKTLIDSCSKEVSYRYLIYTIFDLNPSAYATLQIAGLLDWHNKCEDYDYSVKFNSDKLKQGEDLYKSMDLDEKISLISYLVNTNFKPLL